MTKPSEYNPYTAPSAAAAASASTPLDRFIHEQAKPLLKPGEDLRFTAVLFQSPHPALIVALIAVVGVGLGLAYVALWEWLSDIPGFVMGGIGGVVGVSAMLLLTKPYLAAVTNERIVMFRTRVGAFGPRTLNLGTDQIALRDVTRIKVGGVANNRSLTFCFRDLTERTLRISPWSKAASGTGAFFEYAKSYEGSGE